jgi:tRNA-specific 2-thiouridylase
LYVLHLDPQTRQITLGKNEQLFQKYFELQYCIWATPDQTPPAGPIQVKIRYAASPVEAHVIHTCGNTVQVELSEPQRAITPGQSAVFYCQDRVLGGGIIQAASHSKPSALIK